MNHEIKLAKVHGGMLPHLFVARREIIVQDMRFDAFELILCLMNQESTKL